MRPLKLTEQQREDLLKLSLSREWATLQKILNTVAADVKRPLVDLDGPLEHGSMARRLGFLAALEYALSIPGVYGQSPAKGPNPDQRV